MNKVYRDLVLRYLKQGVINPDLFVLIYYLFSKREKKETSFPSRRTLATVLNIPYLNLLDYFRYLEDIGLVIVKTQKPFFCFISTNLIKWEDVLDRPELQGMMLTEKVLLKKGGAFSSKMSYNVPHPVVKKIYELLPIRYRIFKVEGEQIRRVERLAAKTDIEEYVKWYVKNKTFKGVFSFRLFLYEGMIEEYLSSRKKGSIGIKISKERWQELAEKSDAEIRKRLKEED
jgi:hypothetical protein